MRAEVQNQQLLRRIKSRRSTIDKYLRVARPRADRLMYISVISSAVAAVLTAGPAIGGQKFTTTAVATLNLGGAADVWRPLCLLATIVSVIAAVSANISRSKNSEARIVSAEACSAELEGLQTLVEFDQVSIEEAVKLFQQYVARIPFIPEPVPESRAVKARRPAPSA